MDSTDSDERLRRPLSSQLPPPEAALHSMPSNSTHSIPTLPGVAALLSSSHPASFPPSNEFKSPNHHHHHHHHHLSAARNHMDDPRAVRRSTPPNGSIANPPGDLPAASHPSLWTTGNRSNNANTSNTGSHSESTYTEDTPSSRTQEHHFSRRSVPQTTTLPRSSALTAQVRHVQPQDEPPPLSTSPINAHTHRQDSAFSEQGCIVSNEVSFYLQSSGSPSSHSRRAPNFVQHNFDTYPPSQVRTTPSPPALSSALAAPPPSSVAHPDPVTTTSTTPHRRHTHSRSVSYATSTSPAPVHPLERLSESSTPVDIKAQKNPHNTGASPSSLPDTLPSTARSRYDIGLESQSATMNVEPRQHSPYDAVTAPARPASTEATSKATRTKVRPVELAHQRRTSPATETRNANSHAAPEPAPSHQRSYYSHAPSAPSPAHSPPPRCTGCGAIWSYPLPDLASLQKFGQTQTRNEFARANEGMRALLQKHREGQDAAYARWQWDHGHCVLRDPSAFSPSSPSTVDSQDTISQNGKRKAEMPHEDGQISTKLRRVTFDRDSPIPQSVRVHPSI